MRLSFSFFLFVLSSLVLFVPPSRDLQKMYEHFLAAFTLLLAFSSFKSLFSPLDTPSCVFHCLTHPLILALL